MTHYILSIENPQQQYVGFKAIFQTSEEKTTIFLPSWRPGRYELGNFAKNIKGFKVCDEQGKSLPFTKITKDCWQVETADTSSIIVEYFYYASELNAGSTFLSKEQLYVNPVNCFVYTEASFPLETQVELKVPDTWKIAVGLPTNGKVLSAKNFDELADSPFICSPALQHESYEVNETKFHVWIQGECKPEWDKLISDFKAFSQKQIEKFVEFPTNEYHFLLHILPYKAYHGVEHSTSTVITLGPSYDVFGFLYKELLGISSHELYHTWNVKAIRPIEMYPYNFQTENYSRLGYICEGVTTYMGDLFLLKSGVFSLDQYLFELGNQFQKHFDNFGRFNYSVGDSSFDTWLDGYVPGAPGRKVSIYTEGCLLAFVTDVLILKASQYKYGLDEVMKRLYFNYALQGRGVSEEDYKNELITLIGDTSIVQDLFDKYFNGTHSYETILTEALEFLGLELKHQASSIYSAGRLGFKYTNVVVAIYPGGPADLGGLMLNDEILAVNDCKVNNDLDKWLSYFDNDIKKLTVLRAGKLRELHLPEVQRHFFNEYKLDTIANPNQHQQRALKEWMV